LETLLIVPIFLVVIYLSVVFPIARLRNCIGNERLPDFKRGLWATFILMTWCTGSAIYAVVHPAARRLRWMGAFFLLCQAGGLVALGYVLNQIPNEFVARIERLEKQFDLAEHRDLNPADTDQFHRSSKNLKVRVGETRWFDFEKFKIQNSLIHLLEKLSPDGKMSKVDLVTWTSKVSSIDSLNDEELATFNSKVTRHPAQNPTPAPAQTPAQATAQVTSPMPTANSQPSPVPRARFDLRYLISDSQKFDTKKAPQTFDLIENATWRAYGAPWDKVDSEYTERYKKPFNGYGFTLSLNRDNQDPKHKLRFSVTYAPYRMWDLGAKPLKTAVEDFHPDKYPFFMNAWNSIEVTKGHTYVIDHQTFHYWVAFELNSHARPRARAVSGRKFS
jgi:hypothetical protein